MILIGWWVSALTLCQDVSLDAEKKHVLSFYFIVFQESPTCSCIAWFMLAPLVETVDSFMSQVINKKNALLLNSMQEISQCVILASTWAQKDPKSLDEREFV